MVSRIQVDCCDASMRLLLFCGRFREFYFYRTVNDLSADGAFIRVIKTVN